MIAKKGLKAVGYVRVSTEDQAREGVSLDHQREAIASYCERGDWTLIDVLADNGVSGATLERPGMKAALQMIQEHEADVLIVYKLDRLVRSVVGIWKVVEELKELGAVLVSVSEAFDPTTANGKAFINMIGTFAQWERDMIVERTTAALAHKKAQHEHVGRIPYGFAIGDDGKLIEDPEQMDNIRRMKRERQKGHSLRKIGAKYGLSPSTVKKLVEADLRTIKNRSL